MVLPEVAFQVEPMTVDDLPMVLTIERSCHAFPWRANILQECLEAGHVCHVVKQQQQLLAFGIMSIGAQECHILNLCVRKDARRQGLGAAILINLLHAARQQSAGTAFLEVRRSNRVACSLYRKIGFNEIGVRRRYYASARGREDAIIMAKELRLDSRTA